MIKDFRKLGASIMVIVVVSFLLLIVLQWGANLAGTRNRAQSTPRDVILKGDGIKVTRMWYQENYKKTLRDWEAKNNRHPSSRDYREIKEQAWENLQKDVIWERLLKSERPVVTDDEVWEIIKVTPPQELMQDTSFITPDGKFNYQRYHQLLTMPNAQQWITQYAKMIKASLLKQKVQYDLINTYRLTSNEKKDISRMEGAKVTVRFMPINYSPYPIDSSVSKEEIEKIYKKYKDKYTREERRRMIPIYFYLIPSKADSENAKARIDLAYEALKEGDSFNVVAGDYSDSPYDTIKVTPEKLADTEKVIFNSLKPGDYSKPYFYWGTYNVVRMIEKRKDTFTVNVITVRIRPGEDTKEALLSRIDSFKTVLKKRKGIIDSSLIKKWNIQVRRPIEASKKSITYFVALKDKLWAVKTFGEKAPKGAISEPFPLSDKGFFIFYVSEIKKKDMKPLDSLRASIIERILYLRNLDSIKSFALQLKDSIVKFHRTIDELAPELGVKIDTLTLPSFSMGADYYGPVFSAVVMTMNPGDRYGPVEMFKRTQYGFIECLRREPDLSKLETAYHNRIVDAINALSDSLFKEPEWKDYRKLNEF